MKPAPSPGRMGSPCSRPTLGGWHTLLAFALGVAFPLIAWSCESAPATKARTWTVSDVPFGHDVAVTTVIQGGCHYVVVTGAAADSRGGRSVAIVHAGDCPNPIHASSVARADYDTTGPIHPWVPAPWGADTAGISSRLTQGDASPMRPEMHPLGSGDRK